MTTAKFYSDKVDAFQQLVWDYNHNSELAYEAGEYNLMMYWDSKMESAAKNLNYYIGLHRASLKS